MAKKRRGRKGVLETNLWKREFDVVFVPKWVMIDGVPHDTNDFLTLADLNAIARKEFRGPRKDFGKDILVRGDSSANISFSRLRPYDKEESEHPPRKEYSLKIAKKFLRKRSNG